MSKKTNRKAPAAVQTAIDIILGSVTRTVAAYAQLLARRSATKAFREQVFFDAPGLSQHPSVVEAEAGSADPLLALDNFVAAKSPADHESLEKAEAAGTFALLRADWHMDPAPALDGLGASCNPLIGATLARLNERSLAARISKCITRCLNHNRHGQLVLEGVGVAEKPARLVVNVRLTSVGGMGSGALVPVVDIARTQVARHGLRAKIVLTVLLRGDLAVTDEAQADINQANLLKYLRAVATGQYIDPVTGQQVPSLCAWLYLQSNQNAHGRLESLETLMAHEAQGQHVCRSLARDIEERLNDLEALRYDEFGDPLIGSTKSVGFVRCDRERIVAFGSHWATAVLASALQRKPDAARAKQEALTLARLHGVVETASDARMTSDILAPEPFDGQPAPQRLRSNLADRTAETSGWQRANVLAETLSLIQGTEFAQIYRPAMAKQAATLLQEKKATVEDFIRRRLQGQWSQGQAPDNRFDVLRVLAYYWQVLVASVATINDKAAQLQQLAQPREEVVNAALEELERHRNRSWPGRLLRPFLLGRIARSLEESGPMLLELELQLMACRVTVQNLLEPLVDFVEARLAELGVLSENLRHVAASCKQRADQIASPLPVLKLPLGFDLVDRPYLEEFFDQIVAETGGTDEFVETLIHHFLAEHKSLSTLLGKTAEEIEEIFHGIGESIFAPPAQQKDVFTEFRRLHPSETRQVQLLREVVFQTEGRVRTTGEADQEITWLKYVTVPSESHRKPMRELIERADPKAGKWHVVVDSNYDAITVVQIRSDISLTPLIARCEPTGPGAWEAMVSRAPDPVTALMVPPNPSDRELRRVLVKAIVTGQLVHHAEDGFDLVFDADNPITLGDDVPAATTKIRGHWPYLVRIESTFGHEVVKDDEAVRAKVQDLASRMGAATAREDARMTLIDSTAIEDVLYQLTLLTPRARRLRIRLQRQDRA